MLAPNETVQHLQAARNLIADPEKWCQGALCIVNGEPQNDKNTIPLAERFCAVGALWKTSPVEAVSVSYLPGMAALCLAAEEQHAGMLGPAGVNDNEDHKAVLRMFDRAIELAASGEQPDEAS